MGFREIHLRFKQVCSRLLADVLGRNQASESDHVSASDQQCNGLERRFAIASQGNGQMAASAGSIQRTADINAGASHPAKNRLCADDVARGILGPNSGATISNVLVVGTERSIPLKRMEIHFEDPEQVPAFFNLLAAALKSSGFHLHGVRSSAIPVTDIWLTYPLADRNKILQSCAGLIAEQVDAGMPRGSALHKSTPTLQFNPQRAAIVNPESSHFARTESRK